MTIYVLEFNLKENTIHVNFLFLIFEAGSRYVDQASLKLTETNLPLPPKCWG